MASEEVIGALNDSQSGDNLSLTPSSSLDFYHLNNSDNPVNSLVTTPFDGTNFLSWKRNVMLALGAKQKLGFADGSLDKPGHKTDEHAKWQKCDKMVRCWIANSISAELRDNFSYCFTAHDLWKEILERYSETNAALLYQLKKEKSNLLQGNDSVTTYFTKFKKLSCEIRELDGIPDCTCGGMIEKCSCSLLKRMFAREERFEIVEFLMGLSEAYKHPRNNILGMLPLPPLSKVFARVIQIERQSTVSAMINTSSPEASALYINKPAFGLLPSPVTVA